MDKIYITYWSQTGNTKAMADILAAAIEKNGKEYELVEIADIDKDKLLTYSAFAIGCPAMGDEELDDCDCEPFIQSIEDKISGKSLILFGSYDWGDGEWMRKWEDRMKNAGASIITGQGIIANLEPDEEAKDALEKAAKEIAAL